MNRNSSSPAHSTARAAVAVAVGALLAIMSGGATAAASADPDVIAAREAISEKRMSDFIRELARPEYDGRLAGTPGDTLSRDWILEEFEGIGLQPAGTDGYLQPFVSKITQPDGKSNGTPRNPLYGMKAPTSNLIGILPGNDPGLAKEVVIISGHRDHLGHNPDGVHYPGANDDLSGVASTVELARAFARLRQKNKRTLMFVAYGAEEQHDMGSMYHVDHPVAAAPNKNIVLMITIDMIGRGYDPWADFSQAQMDAYSSRWYKQVYNGSDKDRDAYSHEYPKRNTSTFDYDAGPFGQVGIGNRVIGLAAVANYHKTSDTWEKVHVEPMVNVTRTIFDFVWKVDQDPRPHAKSAGVGQPAGVDSID